MASSSRTAVHQLVHGVCSCLRAEVATSSKGKGRQAAFISRKLHSSAKALSEIEVTQQSGVTTGDAPIHTGILEGAAEAVPQIDEPLFHAQTYLEEDPVVIERRRRLATMDELEAVGSSQTRKTAWQPFHSLSRSQTSTSLTLSHLLASTAHLGHSTTAASRHSFPYTYGTRHGISIIDVRETLTALRRASALIRSTVENDGIILFVGGGPLKDADKVLQRNADKMGRNGYAVTKWLPGTLTNAHKLLGSSSNLIPQPLPDPETGKVPVKPNPSYFMPSLMVLFAPLSTPHALREANLLNIPTVALCDTNIDPRHFTYPIPCNDDSLRVVELVSGVLAEAGKDGANRRYVKAQQDKARLAQYSLQDKYAFQQQQEQEQQQQQQQQSSGVSRLPHSKRR